MHLTIDKLRIIAKGGTGGAGFAKYGGVGGSGGNVIFKTKQGVKLADILKVNPKCKFSAEHGRPSTKFCLRGADAKDTVVFLPPGVKIYDNNSKRLKSELNESGETFLAAKGANGGNVANGFVSLKGEEKRFFINQLLMAEVGLLGFPNAGKTSLLNKLTKSRNEVSPFPFSTVHPYVGHIAYEDRREISIADLPGVIEGASDNVGDGRDFLKHIERTMLLLWVVDLSGFQLGVNAPFRTALESVFLLNKELNQYDPMILSQASDSPYVHRPSVLVINKVDSKADMEAADQFLPDLVDLEQCYHDQGYRELIPGVGNIVNFAEVHTISCQTGHGMSALKDSIRKEIDRFHLHNIQERLSLNDSQ